MSAQGWRIVVRGGSARPAATESSKPGHRDVLRGTCLARLTQGRHGPEGHKVRCGEEGIDLAIAGQDLLGPQPPALERPVPLSDEAGPERRADALVCNPSKRSRPPLVLSGPVTVAMREYPRPTR